MRQGFATAAPQSRRRKKPSPASHAPPYAAARPGHRHKGEYSHRERSPAFRPFKCLKQLFNVVETESGRRPEIPGFDHKRLSGRLLRSHQPQPQKVIDRLLERCSGAADLLVQQSRHIVIESKSSSHIMMLTNKAS